MVKKPDTLAFLDPASLHFNVVIQGVIQNKVPGASPTEAVRNAFAILQQVVQRQIESGVPTSDAAGILALDPDEHDHVIFRLLTKSGPQSASRFRRQLPPDAQSSLPEDWVVRGRKTPVLAVPTADELRAVAYKATAPCDKRVIALRELAHHEPDEVGRYVHSLLAQGTQSEEMRCGLVFMSEEIHFPAQVRQEVGRRLLDIALSLHDSTRAGAERVVWSALRRAVTLLPADPGLIVPFLERRGPIDTRSVALQCIQRMFEPAPPADPQAHTSVANRVRSFADKFLDPDVFAGGEPALIGQNAIFALAALGSPQAGEAVEKARILNRRWMTWQVKTGLQEMLVAWRGNESVVKPHHAVTQLEKLIGMLG